MTTREREARALLGLPVTNESPNSLDEEILSQIRKKREADCCQAWVNGALTVLIMMGLIFLFAFAVNPAGK